MRKPPFPKAGLTSPNEILIEAVRFFMLFWSFIRPLGKMRDPAVTLLWLYLLSLRKMYKNSFQQQFLEKQSRSWLQIHQIDPICVDLMNGKKIMSYSPLLSPPNILIYRTVSDLVKFAASLWTMSINKNRFLPIQKIKTREPIVTPMVVKFETWSTHGDFLNVWV